ncbi:MAG: DUF420 domain-containing protein, partial [Candidatus Omnitrophica bacterium]|nr:DUF420 domain-containing protein [Candidatus Omnitrophota bacterium]
MVSLAALPTVNAALNATSAIVLTVGYLFIRARRILPHIICMGIACLTSTAFLVSYVIYHVHVGSVRFMGQGWIRPVYFAVLLSHTVLAVVILPLVFRTLRSAFMRQFEQHAHIARVTLPLWLYVSVTGVVVYWMLYRVRW